MNEAALVELRNEIAQVQTGVDQLLAQINGLTERLDKVLDAAYDGVGLDAVRQEIAASSSQVRGYVELVERYYRVLQREFKAAMLKSVQQVQDINAETGTLVVSLHWENRELRRVMELLSDRLGLDVALAAVRQLQFAPAGE